MSKLGSYLRKCRSDIGLSLTEVYQRTGITNSRLSRIENGSQKGILNPTELKKLANLYGVGLVSIFIVAGYLDNFDLEEYRFGFKNIELLDDDEKKHIQEQIDFLARKKG